MGYGAPRKIECPYSFNRNDHVRSGHVVRASIAFSTRVIYLGRWFFPPMQ